MKTKKIIATLVMGLLITSLFSQEKNCQKFTNGDFLYPTLENKMTSRQDSIQKSYDNGKLEMVWKVTWNNPCEYDITCIEILNKNLDVALGDKIHVTIVSTEDNCYNSDLVVYNARFPEGFKIPNGPFPLCLKE